IGALVNQPSKTDPSFPPPYAGPGEELIRTMTGNYASLNGEILELRQGDRISTRQFFKPPIAFRLIAKTNSTNIRISYAADQVIFNWEMNCDELRIDGGPAGGRHKPGFGRVPKDEWVTIDLIVKKQSLSIFVDGSNRIVEPADFSNINAPFLVFAGAESTVYVKSLKVGQPT